MRETNRIGGVRALTVLAATTAIGLLAPAAAPALTLSKWEAGTCKNVECTDAGSSSLFYTQAAGHPPFGITDFAFTVHEGLLAKEPDGHVKDVRVDLPPGLAVNPLATPQCSEAEAASFSCPKAAQVGVDKATGTAELVLGAKSTVTEEFPVFNVQRRSGEPARFGVEVHSGTLQLAEEVTGKKLQGVIYLEGGLSWHQEAPTSESSGVASGDYHQFFQIKDIPQQPEIIESKLIFWGVPQDENKSGEPPRAFITLPSTCAEKATTYLHVDSWESPGSWLSAANQTPVTATGCDSLVLQPSFGLQPETSRSDAADGATADLHVPQLTDEPSKPDSPEVRTAAVTLPVGMSLNPSAAQDLVACTDAQIGIGSGAPVACPAASAIGTVSVNAPGIPDGSLTGTLYAAQPESGAGPESGGLFRVFLAAEAPRYGVGVRLEGRVHASLANGQLTAVFDNAPQVPFEDFAIHLSAGSRLVLANPLACGPAQPSGQLTPYTGQPPAALHGNPFTVDADGKGAACPAPLPFSLTQSTSSPKPVQAGAYSPFKLDFGREDGQQYVSQARVTLPAGLIGAIPSVTLCHEPQASQGTCPAASRIATVSALAGAGPNPYPFSGKAFLTGPYQGAPYGLSVVVPAVAGPYDLGNVIVRARLDVGLYDGRVTATAAVPTIFEGVPLRLRSLSVDVDANNFLFNPTNCGLQRTETVLTAPDGTTDSLSSPFQASGCDKLAFSPTFAAEAAGRTPQPKVNGTSFVVRLTQPPHQGNIRQVLLELPKQLAARTSTLQEACTAAEFEAGPPPGTCHPQARVGTVAVSTPVLPDRLTGSAYLVSHGGAAFPDLDLILHGDGVTVVLVGHTFISGAGVTSSKFETLPDVPVNSVEVALPSGRLSALGTNGDLCAKPLLAPTTLVSQTGATIKQSTLLTATGCGLRVLSHRTRHGKLILRVRVNGAGRLSAGGHGLRSVSRRVRQAGTVTLVLPLTHRGKASLARLRRHHRHMSVQVHVFWVPAGQPSGPAAALSVRFG
jgi:hypothetical protein